MHTIPIVLGLLVAVTALALLSRRVGLPYPAVMVIGGLLISFVPHLPSVELDPDVFFSLFLPPLLYAAAWQTSWRDFCANLRPISLLAIGFVLFTTFAIAILAHAVIPEMGWPAACALGAIISPPDAVAATAIAAPLGVPSRIVTVLEGESMVNDASALTVYRFAVAAAVTGTFSLSNALLLGLWAVVGGIGLGLGLGWIVIRLHKQLEDPLVETVITLLTPFVGFIVAEECQASGVLAVVAMGLFVSRQSHSIFSSVTRIEAVSVWNVAVFMLNGLVFVLLGLQLPHVLEHVETLKQPLSTLIGWGVGLFFVMLIVRIIWVFPATYLPRLMFPSIGQRDPVPPWQPIFFIAYTGMRGATSLAAALALPITLASGAPFEKRNIIIFLTFTAILGTLVIQSLTLPAIVRWLKLKGEETAGCEEWEARLRAARAALDRIAELETRTNGSTAEADQRTLRRLRAQYEERIERLAAIESAERDGYCETEPELEVRMYREVLSVERDAVVGLRNTNVIGDDVLRRIQRDLDLEDARYASIEP